MDAAVYGSFSAAALSDAGERVTHHVHESVELANAHRAMHNAFRLYVKTRPAASAESCTRAKALPAAGCHPLFGGGDSGSGVATLTEGAAAIAAALQGFRPSATVLEAEVAAARRGLGAGVYDGNHTFGWLCAMGIIHLAAWLCAMVVNCYCIMLTKTSQGWVLAPV